MSSRSQCIHVLTLKGETAIVERFYPHWPPNDLDVKIYLVDPEWPHESREITQDPRFLPAYQRFCIQASFIEEELLARFPSSYHNDAMRSFLATQGMVV